MDRTNVQRRKGLKSAEAQKQSSDVDDQKKSKKKTSVIPTCLTMILTLSAVAIGSFFVMKERVIDALPFELPPAPEFTGPLSPNTMLLGAEHLLTGEIIGPESMVLHKGSIFTGTHDGKIVEIKDKRIVRTVKSSRFECGDYENEHKCGRPLGIRVLDDSTLVYADANLGLFKLDIETGRSELLVKGGEIIEGKPLTFLNDLVILKNGIILFTDSSWRYPRRDYILCILEHSPSGRLLSYDMQTKKVGVVLDNLYFPNGVVVSADEDFVLVAELIKARILKYHLMGPQEGQVTVFADNLPGTPDNIRWSRNGSLWVPLGSIRKSDQIISLDVLGPLPAIRNFIAKVIPRSRISSIFGALTPKYSLAILLDTDGRIISSLHDPTGQAVRGMSQILDDGQNLYFGSFNAPYLTKLELKN